MDREIKLMHGIYIAVTVFFTAAMLIGGAYVSMMPKSFFA